MVLEQTAYTINDVALLRNLADNAPDMLWAKDTQGRYLFANKAICEQLLMAVSTQEPIGKTDVFFALRERARYPARKDWHTFGELCQNSDDLVLASGQAQAFEEYGNVRGKLLYLNVHKAPLYDDNGQLIGTVGVGRDITRQKQMEESMRRLAYFDSLTDLPNRQSLLETLTQHHTRRTQERLALVFMDLDHFKLLNDTWGHARGDELLAQLANRLRQQLDGKHFLAHTGGDEFALIVHELPTEHEAASAIMTALCQQLLQVVNEPFILSHNQREHYHISTSIGVALGIAGISHVDELLRQADMALYEAKKQGRNTLCLFNQQMQATLDRRARMEMHLRTALERDELEVYFQAKVNALGHYVGAEALLRWHSPELGAVSPVEFIPVAEETGMILPIGDWVLAQACDCLHRWQQQPALQHLKLAVNISERQFRQSDFIPRTQAILSQQDIRLNHLQLELTESSLLDNMEDAIQKMHALARMGIICSLDDFGTGFSSLSYLKRLPVSQLKIDRSFVMDIGHDPDDAAIVSAILAMSQALGLEVVAEGVESNQQLSFLQQHGCNIFQGFLFARPVALTDFERSSIVHS